MMISSLLNRNSAIAKWGQSAKVQETEKTVENAMTDSFVAQIKEYAKQHKFMDEAKMVYYQAFKEARAEIRAAAQVLQSDSSNVDIRA